jgi:hypothetical protein
MKSGMNNTTGLVESREIERARDFLGPRARPWMGLERYHGEKYYGKAYENFQT